MKDSGSIAAGPFIKWAGGKGQILPHIQRMLPEKAGRYFEPFLGGGAVFFRLWSLGLIKKSFLCDANQHLITTYNVVRDNPDVLAIRLDQLKAVHSKEHFYQARDRFNHEEAMSDVERAALLIYMNKTCFNGLFRVNSKGHFNVPIGSYVNPRIFDHEQLLACSAALKNASLAYGDFQTVLKKVKTGDFVYFDPPYVPLTSTANFTAYAQDDFTFQDQIRLADAYRNLSARGARLLLSNHATPELLELYKGFDLTIVPARRMINTKASRRTRPVDEVLVRNF